MAKSDLKGRAFEYACIRTLESVISQTRPVQVINNSNFLQDKNAWEQISQSDKVLMLKEASAAIPTLLELEPMIEDNIGDILTLRLQSDREGIAGDVRDILLIREKENWVIGISVKHNHFAVKHSRLSSSLDFGKEWVQMPCSQVYWDDIEPIFAPLISLRGEKKWSEIKDKEKTVYIPLLKAFKNEILRDNEIDSSVPKKMVEYLLGRFDFYKLIGLDDKGITTLMSFNLRGTLNKASSTQRPLKTIPIASLPTRIVSFDFKPNSGTTLELYMNNGWQFSFRIHNASTMVQPSLKFDVQIIGMPTTIITIKCPWG